MQSGQILWEKRVEVWRRMSGSTDAQKPSSSRTFRQEAQMGILSRSPRISERAASSEHLLHEGRGAEAQYDDERLRVVLADGEGGVEVRPVVAGAHDERTAVRYSPEKLLHRGVGPRTRVLSLAGAIALAARALRPQLPRTLTYL